MRVSFLLAGLLASAVPAAPAAAAEVSAPATQKPGSAEEVDNAAIQADLAAYGAWLNQAIATSTKLQQDLMGFGGRWQAAFARGISAAAVAEMRPVLAELIAETDRSYAALEALPLPVIRVLPLEEDLQPETLTRDLKAINRQVRALIESYDPVLDAMLRNDVQAALRAMNGTIGGVRLLYQNQATIARASLAVTPRDESTWNLTNVGLLFFRSGARVLASWPGERPERIDRSLAPDLRALADELEATSAEGERRLLGELQTARAELAEAERDRDADLAGVLRTGIRVGEIDVEVYAQGRRLAAVLRTGATQLQDGRVTPENLSRLFSAIVPIKVRLDEIALEESAALAGQP